MADAFPHSPTTERQVLAACASDLALLSRYGIEDADFWRADHRALRSWLALESTRPPVPIDVLVDRLVRQPPVGVSLAEATEWLITEAPMPSYLPGLIEQLRADRVRRASLAAVDAAREALAGGTEDVAIVLDRLSDAVRTEIGRLSPGSLGVDLSEALHGLADTLTARRAGRAPAATSTGSAVLDDTIGGFHPGDLVVVAAKPGTGKTSIGLGWCASTAGSGAAAAFFSTEMLTEQLATRIASQALGVSGDVLRGVPSEDLLGAIRDLAAQLDVPVRLWCGRYSPATIAEQARGYAYECKRRGLRLGLVVVDYLQILKLEGRRGASLSELTGAAAYACKDLALELGCSVALLSQLSRGYAHRDDTRPSMTDLRNSGDIEAAADLVLGLHRDDDDPGLLEVIPLKSRHHDIGAADTVPLRRAKGGRVEDYTPHFVAEWRRQRRDGRR